MTGDGKPNIFLNMTGQQDQKGTRIDWRRVLLNYDWIVPNIPFLVFLSMLTLVYIYNGHWAEKKIKDINHTAAVLKELQYEYKTVKSEIMFLQKQSEVTKSVASLGLHEITRPPIRLKDSLAP